MTDHDFFFLLLIFKTQSTSKDFFFLTPVLFHWDFSHGKSSLLSRGKASCDRVVIPDLRCMLGVSFFFFSIIRRNLT